MKREEAEAIYDLGKEAVVAILLKMDARIKALENQVKELQDRLGLNSHNSSKPPPSTNFSFAPKSKIASNAKRKAGGQKGHEGKNLKMAEHPNVIIVSSPQISSRM